MKFMGKKEILIVCRSFYPENTPRSNRATELAKEFVRQGHIVTVLLPKKPDVHDLFEKENNLVIKDLGTLKWKNFNFGKSKIGYLLNRAAFRFLYLAFDYPNLELMFLVKNALKYEKGYDLLISIAVPYPIHWGVAKVWNSKQSIAKTWVADCGDPYMGCTTDNFKKWFHFKYVEKWFMRKANFISIPVESARQAYYPEFHKKIKVIPQGFCMKPIELINEPVQNQTKTFAYAGSFIPGMRDPRYFLDYLATLTIDFCFIIYTNKPDMLKAYESILGEKLKIKSYISREELLAVMAKMDFLVNFDNNTQTAVPSKLIDYAITGRPILNIENPLKTNVIDRFLAGDYSNALEINNIDQYRIENVCDHFLSLIHQ